MENIHASCVAYKNQGILIIGDSGIGKSDLALRLIMDKGAKLVADDRTNIELKKDTLIASCPETIKGLLEVRGIGIKNFPHLDNISINLVVKLVKNLNNIERFPKDETWIYENIKIRQISLYPFECSAVNKLISALGVS